MKKNFIIALAISLFIHYGSFAMAYSNNGYDWATNPMNPTSPLSPFNPINPISPLNPLNNRSMTSETVSHARHVKPSEFECFSTRVWTIRYKGLERRTESAELKNQIHKCIRHGGGSACMMKVIY